jgi:hypothetical protein
MAKSSQDPHEVWTELKVWSVSQKDPVAAKAAIFEFLAVHGTNPHAAPLLPEIFRDASYISAGLPADEKKVLVELADRAFSALKMSYNTPSELNPRKLDTNVPVKRGKPELALHFSRDGDSGIFAPLAPTADVHGLMKTRDTLLKVNDTVLSMNMPVGSGSRKETDRKEDVKSLDAAARSDRGEELIQSLIEKMKEHSAEGGSFRKPRAEPPRKKAKKKPKKKAKKAAKKKAAPKRIKKKLVKKKQAKKPVKKKASKKKKTLKRKVVKKKPTKKPKQRKPSKKKIAPKRKAAKKKSMKKASKKKAVARKKTKKKPAKKKKGKKR